jgi:hypothetical protein
MWAVGSVTGPIVGGAFAQSVSWVSNFNLIHITDVPNQTVALDFLDQPSHRWCRTPLRHLVPEA